MTSTPEFTARPPIEARVLAILDLEKEQSMRRDIPFKSPNLLLALLRLPGGFAERAFDGLAAGLAGELRQLFAEYVASDGARQEGGFSDFSWYDRPEVRHAQQFARDMNAQFTDDRHLLLSVLDSQSNTVGGLRRRLGDDRFNHLVEIVRSLPERNDPAIVPTRDIFSE
jgi:Clp amino terminal domain, pathogenicity island component